MGSVATRAEQPYTEPRYVSSINISKYSIIQLIETDDDDKSSLEPTPTYELVTIAGFDKWSNGEHLADATGFSSQGDIDYFLFQAPFASNTRSLSISLAISTHFYNLNPKNGTWLQIALETVAGTVELQLLVEVPSNPYIEVFDAAWQNNWTDIVAEDALDASVRNDYATWGNHTKYKTHRN